MQRRNMADADKFHAENSVGQLSSVFQRYRTALARAVARIVKPIDIEDIVQETYLRIFQAAQRQPIRDPKSFMLKAARNLALNHVGRADAMNHLSQAKIEFGAAWGDDAFEDNPTELLENQTEGLDSPEVTVQAEEEFLIFCRAIRELPLQCRRAFILKKVYGLPQREVALRLGVSEGTVEKHIAKGIVACSSYMAAHGYARSGAEHGAWANRPQRKAK